ncbi:MAG: CoA-binding protein [Pseudobdellovibrio sp.]
MNTTDADIRKILTTYKKICVYGINPDKSKPSFQIPYYMASHGYHITGVYPKDTVIEDYKVYKTLAEVPPEDRLFVDVFRKPAAIPEVVDEVLKVGGVKVLWLQLGITHPEAEKRAEAAGIQVVSNRCLLIEHRKI